MIPTAARRGLLVALLALSALPGCGDSGPEAEMNEWQKVGPFSVVVRSVAARQVTGTTFTMAGYSKEPLCVITVGVRLDEPGKEIQYAPPSSATLRDGEGRSYRTAQFGAGVELSEGAKGNKVLRPGESIADVLLFEKDAVKAKQLHLRWQLQWMEKVGGEWKRRSGGTARFKIVR